MAGETCWCCREYSLTTPATEDGGLCRSCASRSPAACQTAHQRDGGKTGSQRMLEAL